MDPSTVLQGLDDAQRYAVTTSSHPLVIHAAAGSGKTRVLTRRLAYRAANGEIDPRHALCVTFSRDAAAELRSRLGALGLRDLPAAGTFHSVALSILRARWHDRRMAAPTVLSDRTGYVRRVARGVDPAKLRSIATEIDWARATGLRPNAYAARAGRAGRRPGVDFAVVARVYGEYEAAKTKARLVDFDDLLEDCAQAFERDPAFAAAQRWRFRQLFVDEFQDVNPLQFRLLRAWLGEGRDLCVVGDPNQAIYSWNGADPTLLRRLVDVLGGGEVVQLVTNHRSSPQIVAVAAAAFASGAAPLPDEPGAAAGAIAVADHRGQGPVPDVIACPDEAAEVTRIAAWLAARRDQGIAWRDQAVLVRTNALARFIHDGLEQAGIAVMLSTRRAGLLSVPMARDWVSLMEALDGPADPADHDGPTNPALSALAQEYAAIDPQPSPAGFGEWLRTVDASGTAPRRDAVTISTFHAAKGREWLAVVVAGLEEGFVPSGSPKPASALEAEERRLLYVALSRATERLACTWSASRTFRDNVVERLGSRYLAALSAACDELLAQSAPVDPRPYTTRLVLEGRVGKPAFGARSKGAGSEQPSAQSPRDRRLAALVAWRDRQARAAAVAPTLVLSDATLVDLAAHPPADLAELAGNPAVGSLRANRYGPSLLTVLQPD